VDELDQVKGEYPKVLELLASDFRENGYDLERAIRAIVSTRAYGLASSLPPERSNEDQEKLVQARALYPLKPLHPDQLANAIWQATTFTAANDDRNVLIRFARSDQTGKFVTRHGGDLDSEVPEDPTMLQRVLLMNGELVHERIKGGPFSSTSRLDAFAPTDAKIVETAYLMTLARRPSQAELEHFLARLAPERKDKKAKATEDLFWALLNSVEFSWNH